MINLCANRTDYFIASERIKYLRRTLGNFVESLSDVFALHLLLTDYKFIVPKKTNLTDVNKDELLTIITCSVFHDVSKKVLEPGTTIGFHVSGLGIHGIIKVDPRGKNEVYYNSTKLDDAGGFKLDCLLPEGKSTQVFSQYKNVTKDIASFCAVFALLSLRTDNWSWTVPHQHPNYAQSTWTAEQE